MGIEIIGLGILPNTVALAIVAVLGYLFGRRRRPIAKPDPSQMRRELERAKPVVNEMEKIAQQLRQNLASHHSNIVKFRDRLRQLDGALPEEVAADIRRETDELLNPTIQLASSMAIAYESLRRQSDTLASFNKFRTDALTGLSNGQVLSESIDSLLALKRRYRNPFAIAVFDVDSGHGEEASQLSDITRLLESCVRETDIVGRFGGTEFVVVMPETDLEGAAMLARRVRRAVESGTETTVSAGLAYAINGDEESSLLARADEALYAAKAAGRNCIYQHDGLQIEAVASMRLLGDVTIDSAESVKTSSREAIQQAVEV